MHFFSDVKVYFRLKMFMEEEKRLRIFFCGSVVWLCRQRCCAAPPSKLG